LEERKKKGQREEKKVKACERKDSTSTPKHFPILGAIIIDTGNQESLSAPLP
jgi:hypothetical protein